MAKYEKELGCCVVANTYCSIAEEAYKQGVKDTYARISKQLDKTWKFYESDTINIPEPNFLTTVAMVAVMEEIDLADE